MPSSKEAREEIEKERTKNLKSYLISKGWYIASTIFNIETWRHPKFENSLDFSGSFNLEGALRMQEKIERDAKIEADTQYLTDTQYLMNKGWKDSEYGWGLNWKQTSCDLKTALKIQKEIDKQVENCKGDNKMTENKVEANYDKICSERETTEWDESLVNIAKFFIKFRQKEENKKLCPKLSDTDLCYLLSNLVGIKVTFDEASTAINTALNDIEDKENRFNSTFQKQKEVREEIENKKDNISNIPTLIIPKSVLVCEHFSIYEVQYEGKSYLINDQGGIVEHQGMSQTTIARPEEPKFINDYDHK